MRNNDQYMNTRQPASVASAPPASPEVTGLLLAGGLGRRMGGLDKGLQPFRGRPLAAWVLDRLTPQVGSIIINANRNLAEYEKFGWPVVSDTRREEHNQLGPLAGLHAGLAACRTPLLLCAPCDTPFLPTNLVTRLGNALTGDKNLAVARVDGRLQPVVALMRSSVIADLEQFLDRGARKVEAWLERQSSIAVDFPDISAFANINSLEDMAAAAGHGPANTTTDIA